MSYNIHNTITELIWNIADGVLRDVNVCGKYHDKIFPMTIIRRLPRTNSDVVTGKVDVRRIKISDYKQVELDVDISGEEENDVMVDAEGDEE